MTASIGSLRTGRCRRANLVPCLIALLLATPGVALARDVTIAIPRTTLDIALPALARQTNTEIVSTEPGLRAIRSPALDGAMSVSEALDRLLRHSGLRAVALPIGGYRIVRAALPAPPRRAAPPPAPQQGDVVVVGSKQRVTLLRYPGSVTQIGETSAPAIGAMRDMSNVAEHTPILQTTALGPGRNKLFIRGVADSSFNGGTQSTAGIYLDDVQISYSGADPGLRLYDIKNVEVLEGPQGTLYGAGAIGGVIRLTSNPPDLQEIHGSASAGITATRSGQPGFDVDAMFNVPLVRDELGVRGVLYGVREGGFIDDLRRKRKDVNRTDTVGGRLTLRADAGDGWHFDIGAAEQEITGADGQYAQGRDAPLARRSYLAQPYGHRLITGRVVAMKEWQSGLQLDLSGGLTSQIIDDQFDATPAPASGTDPLLQLYTLHTNKLMLTQETRLSRSLDNGESWVAGFTLLRARDSLTREVGTPAFVNEIIGVTNVTKSGSVFGETTQSLLRGVSATIGARFTVARIDGDPSARARLSSFVKGRTSARIDPTVALSWKIAPQLAAFARLQTGFRTGGLAVARGVGRVANFAADSIVVGEAGLRRLRNGPRGIALSGSVSIAHWVGIQADLIDRVGQPFTTNIGNASIQTVEGSIGWVPIDGWQGDVSFLYTHNEVSGRIATLSTRNNRRLADTPPLAISAALSHHWQGAHELAYRLRGSAQYTGRSVLGTGDLLDVSQGNYVVLGASGSIARRGLEVSLAVENATDDRASRFAFGNPFTIARRNQSATLRPLNIRLGISRAW